MSWTTSFVTMTRVLVNDLGTTQRWTDDNIMKAIVVGGILLDEVYTFGNDYTYDLDNLTISPDPSSETAAMALMPLKAACIINGGDYISALGKGIRVRDGDSEVDTTKTFGGYKDILTLGPCAALDSLLMSKSIGVGGAAVMSPISTTTLSSNYAYDAVSSFYNGLTYGTGVRR